MKFKKRNLRTLAELVVGDAAYFPYRSSSHITEFFEDCGLSFVHNGYTRWRWTADRLSDLLADPHPPYALPDRLVNLLRVLMDKSEAQDEDEDRSLALEALNRPLKSEGFEAFYGDDDLLYIRHLGTRTLSTACNPHRPFTPQEVERRELLSSFLSQCSEDTLIEELLLPLFRQLGYHRVTPAGHKDKALE